MKAIGKLIGFLETGKIIAIVNTIKGIANSHSKRGVLVQQFTPVCDILLKYLGEAFGDQLSNEGTATWKKFLDIFSGGKDLSYDVIDHRDVNRLFGTKEDLDELLTMMEEQGMYAILSFIPNHTSCKSEWFQKSLKGDPEYKDYYVWKNKTNNWISTTDQTAWEKVDDSYYLHHFLPEMPDLNLKNENVRNELKSIMRYWLCKPAVYGLHLSGVNLLIEDYDDPDIIHSDVNLTLSLLEEWKKVAHENAHEDRLRRLLILEMVNSNHISDWNYDDIVSKGDVLGFKIRRFIHSLPDSIWPNWQIDNTNIIGLNEVHGRVSFYMNKVSMIMAMLLPGSVILYYGDEIGMINNDLITFDETEDPYALPPYADATNYKSKSRDSSRSPMQWSNTKYAGFTNGSKEPWLPVNHNYPSTNVEDQMNSGSNNLRLYHQLLSLRCARDFYEGDVYFPYQGHNTFSFIRKIKESDKAYLIVVLLGFKYHEVDFTIIFPDFPREGTIKIVTHERTNGYKVGDVVDLSKLCLKNYIGMVIEIDFGESKALEKMERKKM
ncbi:unnamed protein product [Lepeophtheirus salmonis]|uniref:alpha-glucosidase n=1 Tax=Lepeophtheirus salmonis TaxID=72036 RepID=A0A7R8CEE3_LEPSM|nr:unnamed protein product [Lepeophtheirus salmonis]CAF2794658.1 unnamed protein product [Lepeophtheirus salmonis]